LIITIQLLNNWSYFDLYEMILGVSGGRVRERPFNLKGGGVWFFSKKNILIPNVAEKNILILVEEKNNNLIQSFCHIT
jgi:hypothetical protein